MPRLYQFLLGLALAALVIGAGELQAGPNDSIFTTGDNAQGQLGDGSTTASHTPLAASGNAASEIASVATGDAFTLFIKDDGSLHGMGNNFRGQLGTGTTAQTNSTPVAAAGEGTSGVVMAAGGTDFSLFIKTNGSLFGMGLNNIGQLGQGSAIGPFTSPVGINLRGAVVATAIAAGDSHTLIVVRELLSNIQSLRVMGSNFRGQLGTGNTTSLNLPTAVGGEGASGVVGVAAGLDFSLFLKDNGSLWSMGLNSFGQLGDGTTTNRLVPTAVLGEGASDVVMVVAGQEHVVFLKTDGSLWGMGRNNFGQLGIGSSSNSSTPVAVLGAGSSGVAAVAAGDFHTVFLKTDGTLWTFGTNGHGQLGIGNNVSNSTPVQVIGAGGLGVRNLAAGGRHTVFIKDATILPTVSISKLADGTEPEDHGSFRLTRTGATNAALAVNVSYGGNASAGLDYLAPSTTLTIPVGAASLDTTVKVLDDVDFELVEDLLITVTSGTGYAVGTPDAATILITSDDAAPLPVVTVTASDASAAEPNDDGAFTVTRTGATTADLVVTITAGGSATAGSDYQALPATVTILAGNASVLVPVTVLDDTEVEADETVTLAIAADPAYIVGTPSSATVDLTSEDFATPVPVVTVTASDASAAEPNDHGAFTVSRTGATTADLVVTITAGGSATPDADYEAFTATVTILAGNASVLVPVTVVDDLAVESDETVTLTITADPDYLVGTPSNATVDLTSDDLAALPVVTVTASDASAAEPSNHGAFTVTRTGATTASLVVSLTVGGSATAAGDYQTLPTTVTIASGSANAVVPVTVLDDSAVENDETVILTLASDAGYTVGTPSSATVTLVDDSDAGIISVTPAQSALGTVLTVTGRGFGTKSVTVRFIQADFTTKKPKQFTAKVVKGSLTNTQVQVVLRTGRVGDFHVALLPRGVRTPLTKQRALTLMAPDLQRLSTTVAPRNTPVTLTGQFFGVPKGTVTLQLGKKKTRVKITSWTDTQITFTVPKKQKAGDYTVTLKNKLGTVVASDLLTITN